jgi:hypothetical protein
MDYCEIGDTIHGPKIYVEARKIEGYRVIVKTGRHKAQSVTLIENLTSPKFRHTYVEHPKFLAVSW